MAVDVRTRRWEAEEGLGVLGARRVLRVPDPGRFRAQCRSVRDGDAAVAEWRTTPLTWDLARSPGRDGAAMLVIAAGSMRYLCGRRLLVARAGSMHLLAHDRVAFVEIPEAARLLLVPLPSAPDGGAWGSGRVPVGPATAALTLLLERLLRSGGAVDAALLEAVRGTAAVVAHDLAAGRAPADLRAEILEYIELHLHDPRLTPARIARAMGISLRWAHHEFDREGVPLAAHIRQRRLERIADRLLSEDVSLADLALESGFGGRDQLRRNFRARYGSTVSLYVGDPPRDA